MVSSLKNDLKRKFKKLTKQEFYIFSLLYSVEEELKTVTHKDLAEKTKLSESSIRDYIIRLIKKGIPVIKEKVNNKTTILKISPDLRNIATLEVLLRMRE